MSSDFDRLFRGRVYCSDQKATSPAFDRGFDQINWSEDSVLEEVEERGNHSGSVVKHFKVKNAIQL